MFNLVSAFWKELVELCNTLLFGLQLTDKVHILGLIIDAKVLDYENLVHRKLCLLLLSSIKELNLPVLISSVDLELTKRGAHRKEVVTELSIV